MGMELSSTRESLRLQVIAGFETRRSAGAFSRTGIDGDVKQFAGKMLRTRLSQALAGDRWQEGIPYLVKACMALELIHTASLFHDDVVDGASLRRGKPTLWRVFTPSSAVLFGDLLFCEALSVMLETGNSRLYRHFNEKVKEVCEFESRQELLYRGTQCDAETCLTIARGKTGPLFAFAAMVCAGEDLKLEQALQEAGYRVGCAYQIADDILDEYGTESGTGKTLGTDRLRRKFTLAMGEEGEARRILTELCESASFPLAQWPEYKQRLRQFMAEDFSGTISPSMPTRECIPG